MEKKKILIVEDETALVGLLKGKLEEHGYEVFTAKDGVEGLEQYAQHKPNLVLLDLIMPRMDGVTMLGKLRERENGKTAPVIILTNLSDDNALSESIAKGVSGYLIKINWSLEEIMEKIDAKLKA